MFPAGSEGGTAGRDASLDQAWFDAAMAPLGPWNKSRRVAVAVSGGADSLCLAWLTAGWGHPLALIVDHGLRPDSAAEAAWTAGTLAGFGVPSRILTLHLAPGSGLAARARLARYAALEEAAVAAGLADLLLGHHAGDQAETVLLRAGAGSGPAGLAGMAALVETPCLRLVRPLLTAEPDRLRATLRAHAVGWAEDPGNASPAATRTRLRRRLAEDSDGMAARLLCRARAAGIARAARDDEVARILARRVSLFPEAYALLTPGPIAPDALAALVRALTGAPYAPAAASLARLAAWPRPATLGGLALVPAGRLGPGLLILREAAAMPGPVAARRGAVWDRRFRLAVDGDLPDSASMGALGDDARHLRHLSGLPSAVLCTLPALRAPGGALAVPHLGHFHGWTNRRVRPTFLPSSPAAGARFAYCLPGDAQPAQDAHVLDRTLRVILD